MDIVKAPAAQAVASPPGSEPSIDSGVIPTETVQQLTIAEHEYKPPRTKLRLGFILLALYLALFIAALDHTIVATAIPTISADLQSASGYFWIGSAYLLADAAAGPVWAKISDIWGRKPALLAAVAWFFVASIVAARAHNVEMLISARALQGTAAGGLIQLVNITISDLFSMRQRTLFLGMVNVVWALAGGIGPLVGGALAQYVSWRWIFWINLPICFASFVMLFIWLDVHNPRTKLSSGLVAFDWLGTISIVGVVLMLLLGLDFGGVVFPWNSATVICLIVFGVVMAGVFLFTEKRLAKYPLMPLEIFRNQSTSAAFAVCFCHGMVFIASSYYMPLYFQSVKQAGPLRSGVLILPYALPEAVIGIVNGVIMLKTGHYRELIWVGLVLLTIGTALYSSLTDSTPLATVIGFELIVGFGSGCLFEAPLVAVQSMTPQDDTAAATATFGLIRNVATAMSLVLGGVVFQNGTNKRSAGLERAGLGSSLVEAFSDSKAAANVELIRTIQDSVQREAVEAAYAWSLHNMWIMYACVSGTGFLICFFIAHRKLSTEHTETRTGLKRKMPETVQMV
ncbi:Putative major facilitator superfamily, MFS transporter superfamily [Septoria linicola]|uniref:Major facilitator superfamily, MFS transporter superfamily n=1 Tax=Septoria linicola TaxID=215465 RepID=A0A9Q9EJ85_9PEZI|nr:putative major facilitator superfamily, MFS transporter superfamily [Septoria linicola]USW51093.1 Putative major facilitator superfamily, MFS transporter superfamily [Septoria linicola]